MPAEHDNDTDPAPHRISPAALKQAGYIFLGVLLTGLLVQTASRTIQGFGDKQIWAREIRYFLDHDPRAFDLYGAYAHPGATIVLLGSAFHLAGFSEDAATTLSMSVLVSIATAACAAVCFLLYGNSAWWFSTAFILLFSRFYFFSTPPSAAATPFIVLMVLTTWWLWERPRRPANRQFLLWGIVLGVSSATRLDISLLVGLPMLLLLGYRRGFPALLPSLMGACIGFAVSDPFLWFMPFQHLKDLAAKFYLHYAQFPTPITIPPLDLLRFTGLALISIGWACILLTQRRFSPVPPFPILITLISITVLALIAIFSSRIQLIRYLSPLLVLWEVLLPLSLEGTFMHIDRSTPPRPILISIHESRWIILIVILVQFAAAAFL